MTESNNPSEPLHPPPESLGTAQGFRRIYDAHAPRVFMTCLRMTGGDEAEAEEITQEVFIRVWRKRHAFGGWGSLGAWIRRIAVNVALNRQRSVRRRRARELPMADPAVADTGSRDRDTVERLAIESAIRGLPEGARRALVLHDIEGYRHREIAEMTGVAVGTVKSQLHRARRLLREQLEE